MCPELLEDPLFKIRYSPSLSHPSATNAVNRIRSASPFEAGSEMGSKALQRHEWFAQIQTAIAQSNLVLAEFGDTSCLINGRRHHDEVLNGEAGGSRPPLPEMSLMNSVRVGQGLAGFARGLNEPGLEEVVPSASGLNRASLVFQVVYLHQPGLLQICEKITASNLRDPYK